MRQLFFFCLGLTLSTVLAGCEGFKSLTLYNRTGQPITVQTGERVYRVAADSCYPLLTSFTFLLFNEKIRERDLGIDYLKIVTPKDTIIAKDRSEIVKLIKDERTRYRRRRDRSFAFDNNRNVEAIVIR